jgi:gluconate kinase
MPAALLDSQLADLEPPCPDENSITIEVAGTAQQTAEQIIDRLCLTDA